MEREKKGQADRKALRQKKGEREKEKLCRMREGERADKERGKQREEEKTFVCVCATRRGGERIKRAKYDEKNH